MFGFATHHMPSAIQLVSTFLLVYTIQSFLVWIPTAFNYILNQLSLHGNDKPRSIYTNIDNDIVTYRTLAKETKSLNIPFDHFDHCVLNQCKWTSTQRPITYRIIKSSSLQPEEQLHKNIFHVKNITNHLHSDFNSNELIGNNLLSVFCAGESSENNPKKRVLLRIPIRNRSELFQFKTLNVSVEWW